MLVFLEKYLLMPIKLVECPRDAMQGIHEFIPTAQKVGYLNQLLRIGFDTLDFGSFVSPKAIPQLADTAEVLGQLELDRTQTQLLAIIANLRGAEEACKYKEIAYLGFPFSVSETFQQRNTNSSIEQSLITVEAIQNLCVKHGKTLVVYLSMGFGNPYGDPWNAGIVIQWAERLSAMGIKILSLSDTIGVGTPENISYLFGELIPALPQVEFGAHLHTTPDTWREKIVAAYGAGCLRYDGAIKGFGGCPMAADKLTGNMPTEMMLSYFDEIGVAPEMDRAAFGGAISLATKVFPVEA